MACKEVQGKLQVYFQNNILYNKSIDQFDTEESLISNGHIDSIGIIGLVSFLEKAFDIKICENEIIPENFDTLNRICKYVGSKIENI